LRVILGFIHLLVPFGLSLIPIFLKIKRKRFAALWITLGYILYALASVTVIAISIFQEMAQRGEGDPQLMAGQLAENMVGSILFAIIAIPVALLLYWAYRKCVRKA